MRHLQSPVSGLICRQLIALVGCNTIVVAIPVIFIYWKLARSLTATLAGLLFEVLARACGIMVKRPVLVSGGLARDLETRVIHVLPVASHVVVIEYDAVNVGNGFHELWAHERLHVRDGPVIASAPRYAFLIGLAEPCCGYLD